MLSSIIIFPGSNCDRDMAVALEKFGFKNTMVWHNEKKLPKSDLVVLPGGFSYGDYLRTGCVAAKSGIINEVINYANDGGTLLGICNGFQILTETGLLPGVLLNNKYLKFICRDVYIKVKNTSKFFSNNLEKKFLKFHIAHNEGCYYIDNEGLKKITENNQIAIEYCNDHGEVTENVNPNGSINNIAGIYNLKKNILGMMPHPERMIDPIFSGNDGSSFFKQLIKNL